MKKGFKILMILIIIIKIYIKKAYISILPILKLKCNKFFGFQGYLK